MIELTITLTCRAPKCKARSQYQVVGIAEDWIGDDPGREDFLPSDWSRVGGAVFCPEHENPGLRVGRLRFIKRPATIASQGVGL